MIADAIDDALVLVGPPLALTRDLHVAARALAETYRLSFYDALIIAAAIEAGCDTLYGEDIQHGRAIGPLRPLHRKPAVNAQSLVAKVRYFAHVLRDQGVS